MIFKKKNVFAYTNQDPKQTIFTALIAGGLALIFFPSKQKTEKLKSKGKNISKYSFANRTRKNYNFINSAIFSGAVLWIYNKFLKEKHPDFMEKYKINPNHIEVEPSEFIDIDVNDITSENT